MRDPDVVVVAGDFVPHLLPPVVFARPANEKLIMRSTDRLALASHPSNQRWRHRFHEAVAFQVPPFLETLAKVGILGTPHVPFELAKRVSEPDFLVMYKHDNHEASFRRSSLDAWRHVSSFFPASRR